MVSRRRRFPAASSYSRRTRVALRFRGRKRGSVAPSAPRSRNFPWIGRCCSIEDESTVLLADCMLYPRSHETSERNIEAAWKPFRSSELFERWRLVNLEINVLELVNNKFCNRSILLLRRCRSGFEGLERKASNF